MQIHYTMFSTGLTGGVKVLFEIINGLAERGHEVIITTLGSEKEHVWFNFHPNVKINHIPRNFIKAAIRFGLKKIFDIRTYPYHEIRLVEESIPDVDINVATYCFTAFSVYNSQKGVPFYHIQHYEPLFFGDNHFKRMVEQTYYLPFNRIVNSKWLKSQLEVHHEIYDTTIVNPAIDHSIFYPRAVKKDQDKMRVVCYGKKHDWKGFREALKAMEIVMKQRKDVEFIVFGPSLPKHSEKVPYKHLKFISDDELAELYSSADVVFSSSWYESFPLPPIEAMACGAPVVTTQYGTEDYALNEINALVVPPKDPRALAKAILRLLNDDDLREKIRKKGIETAREYTWEKTTKAIEDAFRKSLM